MPTVVIHISACTGSAYHVSDDYSLSSLLYYVIHQQCLLASLTLLSTAVSKLTSYLYTVQGLCHSPITRNDVKMLAIILYYTVAFYFVKYILYPNFSFFKHPHFLSFTNFIVIMLVPPQNPAPVKRCRYEKVIELSLASIWLD